MTLASIDFTPVFGFPLEWAALALLVTACIWWERAGASGIGVEGAVASAMIGMILGYEATWSYPIALAVGLGAALVFAAITGTLLELFRADPAVGSFVIGLIPVSGLGLLLRSGRLTLLEEATLPGIVRGTTLSAPAEDLLMNPVLWAAPLVIALAAWMLWQTPFGLRVRAFGEAPSLRLPGASPAIYRVTGLVVGALWAFPAAALLLSAHRANPPSGIGYLALACAVASRWSIAFAILLALLPAAIRCAIPAMSGTPFGFAVEAAPFAIALVYLLILARRSMRMPESRGTRVDPDVL
jgi:ABC-type uncharacterized transport system permease subunit